VFSVKKYTVFLILVSIFIPTAVFALETTLTWQLGKDTILFNESVKAMGTGFSAVLTTSVGEYDSLEMDGKRSTVRWQRRVQSENTDVSAERNGSKVRVRGTYKGKPYDKTHDIGDLSWFQLHEISYEELYSAGVTTANFWTIDRKTMKPTEFRAELQLEESITIMGAPVQSIKYALTVNGVPSILFTSHFWLRKTDGRFLKLEVPAVLGLPRSSVVLTGES